MKSLKIASMAAIALIAAGCASQPKVDENSEIAALRADIAEVKSIAMQANEKRYVGSSTSSRKQRKKSIALSAANNTSKQQPNVFRKKHRKVLFSCPQFAGATFPLPF